MYSDNDSVLSSDASGLENGGANYRGPANEQPRQYDDDDSDRYYGEPMILDAEETGESTSNYPEGIYLQATEEGSVPAACMERCIVLIDCAMFDPRVPSGDPNERVVEASMKVVHYPFSMPQKERIETMLYRAQVSATGMKKVVRAQVSDRWVNLIEQHHGIPCLPRGVNTGFDKLLNTVKTFLSYLERYSHLQPLKKDKAGGQGCAAAEEDARLFVAMSEEDLYEKMPDMLRHIIDAATKTCEQEEMPRQVAFLTTAKQYQEVCAALMWLQRNANISLPPYQVFTMDSAFDEAWDELVEENLHNFRCGYHGYLMTNSFGNVHHCCESTVRAMAHIIDTAVCRMNGN